MIAVCEMLERMGEVLPNLQPGTSQSNPRKCHRLPRVSSQESQRLRLHGLHPRVIYCVPLPHPRETEPDGAHQHQAVHERPEKAKHPETSQKGSPYNCHNIKGPTQLVERPLPVNFGLLEDHLARPHGVCLITAFR